MVALTRVKYHGNILLWLASPMIRATSPLWLKRQSHADNMLCKAAKKEKERKKEKKRKQLISQKEGVLLRVELLINFASFDKWALHSRLAVSLSRDIGQVTVTFHVLAVFVKAPTKK